MPETIYTVRQVMEYLELSRPTIYRYIRSGALKSTKIGKSHRITESALREFVNPHTEVIAPTSSAGVGQDPRALARAEGISLAEAKRRIAGGAA